MMGDILFLSHRIPWPPDRGDKIRSHHILRRLCEMAPVHIGTFADDERDASFTNDLAKICASVHVEKRIKPQWQSGIEALITGKAISVSSFASRSMQAYVDDVLANHNISHIFAFSGQLAQFVPPNFAGRFVMDFVDVDSAKFESYGQEGKWPMRWINAREGHRLADFEHEIARRADMNLLVSPAEAKLFQDRSGLNADKIQSLGNGIDLDFFNPKADFAKLTDDELPIKRGAPHMIFTGQMDYRPNVEAVCYFVDKILPRVRVINPDAHFTIVGRNPTKEVIALAGHGAVTVTGSVDDVRGWIDAADLVVAPLQIARGIQNKVLEAMAMQKAVVASDAAATGIAADHGKHFYVADNVKDEAAYINELLSNIALRKKIGKAARAHVTKYYSWAGQLRSLNDIMHIGANL